MLQVSINNRSYELPLGELYRDNFSAYINGDTIYLDNLDIKLRYKKIAELFDRVSKSFVMFMDQMEEDPYFEDKDLSKELRGKIDPVDRLQKYFYKTGNLEKSIKIINELMENMLKLYNKVLYEDKENVKKVG